MPIATDTTSSLLQVEDLSTWFHTAHGVVRAVDGVSFSLDAGTTLGIVGESGSGKSVLARSIMNLLPANASRGQGRALFRGRDISNFSPKQLRRIWGKEIGMVFQDPMTSLNPVVRVGRHITEVIKAHTPAKGAAANRLAEQLLTAVGIPEPGRVLTSRPHELSGGMRQRVGIAIAVACSPALLIADEPTTALDVTVQRQILDLIGSLQRERGMAVILITHDLGVVAGRTDELAVMYAGQIVEKGTTASVFGSMRHPYTEALLGSIPRLSQPSHTRLRVIPGGALRVIDAPVGCRFAPRCASAQERCLVETPALVTDAADAAHEVRCFFPVGTPEGEAARNRNLSAGASATALVLDRAAR